MRGASRSELGADCCISVGGGSTTGLGKAIALTSGLPVIAVPTTYSGSEMTAILGMTEGGMKKTLRDPKVLPKTVIYDPALTLGLPVQISAASGMNAIAHCVEALYAADGNPINALQAEEGIRAMAAALPRVVKRPRTSKPVRTPCTAPGWPAFHSPRRPWGCTTSSATSLAAPSTCRTPRRTASCCRMRRATTAKRRRRPWRGSPGRSGPRMRLKGLWDLESGALGLEMRLAGIGMPAEGLERAARIATESPYPNPRPVEYAGVLSLLNDAYEGRRPAA